MFQKKMYFQRNKQLKLVFPNQRELDLYTVKKFKQQNT